MAKETSTHTANPQSENPFLNYPGTAIEAAKEIWAWQVKTSQVLVDQTLQMTQGLTDYAQTQVQESTRMGQSYMKQGMALGEDLRKSLYSLSEKIVKN